MIRLLVLAAAAVPFFRFAYQDLRYHLGPRKPGTPENLVHLGLGIAQIALFVAAARARLPDEVLALGAIAGLGALDEFVFHRALPERESDLHAKSHFALLLFVAVALAVNHGRG
jgi:predicted Kef-type K+ transport protein